MLAPFLGLTREEVTASQDHSWDMPGARHGQAVQHANRYHYHDALVDTDVSGLDSVDAFPSNVPVLPLP